jgi:hypothetical protein
MRFFGTYGGVVENVRDPEKLGRAKVRVAHIHGVSSSAAGYIGVNDLPWAMPAGMPAGGSAQSGGFSHLPAPGDHVWVRFLDGEPEKPIWEWGMQTFSDRDKLKLHPYAMTATGEVGKPQSSFWTRFNHALELAETGINAITSQGYRLQIIDGEADGRIDLSTSLGNLVRLDDLDNGISVFANEDLAINVGEAVTGFSNNFDWTTMTGDFSVQCGGSVDFQTTYDFSVGAASNITLDALAEASLTAPIVRLGSAQAVEPNVLGTQLTLFLESLLLYLSTHTHGNGNNGSNTFPPVIPPIGIVQPEPSLLISRTVFTS